MSEQVSMQIMMRLRQIIREMAKHSKHIQENYKITVPQLICLREVFEHGPISIGALTNLVFLNNSTVTGIIDRLEKRQFVNRSRISKDRRQVHVEITDQGIQFIKEAPAPIHKRFIDRLKALDDEQVTMIVWSLEMLLDMLAPRGATIEVTLPARHLEQPEDELPADNSDL